MKKLTLIAVMAAVIFGAMSTTYAYESRQIVSYRYVYKNVNETRYKCETRYTYKYRTIAVRTHCGIRYQRQLCKVPYTVRVPYTVCVRKLVRVPVYRTVCHKTKKHKYYRTSHSKWNQKKRCTIKFKKKFRTRVKCKKRNTWRKYHHNRRSNRNWH